MATKIKQITATGGDQMDIVYGLGEDNRVYIWCSDEAVWKLFKD